MKYNYLEAVTNDAKVSIFENMDMWEWHNREELEENANDWLWTADEVTGNASGSYTCNREAAKEYVTQSNDGTETTPARYFGVEDTSDVFISWYDVKGEIWPGETA